MTRERWFFAQGTQRRGPIPLAQLVESLLSQAEPNAVLVWRKGFAEWTRAEDVPEVESSIAPVLAKKAAEEAARRRSAPAAVQAPPRRPLRVDQVKPGSPALVYGGIAAGVAVLSVLAWLFWPRADPVAPAPSALPLGGTSAETAPAVVIPARPRETPLAAVTATPTPAPARRAIPAPATPPPAAATLAESERDLAPAELKRLRGVATWSGDTLKLTIYNGTAWRVTELYVKVSRFKDDDFVEDPRPIVLVPPGAAVDAGVADLLSRVAPDRKKPGLNPADTGSFAGRAGQQPENFRWEIEAARGYPPAR